MIAQTSALQSSTQKYLEIYDITNNVIILQDGAVSMVMRSSAINFDLYSEEEQDAAIYAYAALLNSLSFPIEIVIRSQRKDVSSYLDLLKDQEVHSYSQTNKQNIRRYREFVQELVQERNVLDKKFYIIITFTAIEAGFPAGSSLIPGMGKKSAPVLDKQAILEKAIVNLEPRREHLIHQFARIGLFLHQLNTQDLIQLYYTIYNPDASEGIKVTDTKEYISPLVQADIRPQDQVGTVAPPIQTGEQPAAQITAAPSPLPVIPPPMTPPVAPPTPIPVPTPPVPNPEFKNEAPTVVPTSPTLAPAPVVTPTPSPTPAEAVTPPIPSAPVVTPPTVEEKLPVPPPPTPESVTPSPIAGSAIKEDSFVVNSDLKPPTPPSFSTVPPVQGTT